ncbi:MAG: hypothetical protein WKF77_05330 [Planctomycetaceae bacterium]
MTWDSAAEPSDSGSGSGSSGSGSGESSGSGSGSGTTNPPPVVYPYTIERSMDNHVTGHKNWSSGGSATFTRTTNSSSGSSGSFTGTGTDSGSGSGSGSSSGRVSADSYGSSGSGTSGYYDGSSGSGSGSGSTDPYGSGSSSGSGSGSGSTETSGSGGSSTGSGSGSGSGGAGSSSSSETTSSSWNQEFASSYDHHVGYAGFYVNAFMFGGNGDGNGVYTSTYNGVTTTWNENGTPTSGGGTADGTASGSGTAGGSGSSSSGGEAAPSGLSILDGRWMGNGESVTTSSRPNVPGQSDYQLVSLNDEQPDDSNVNRSNHILPDVPMGEMWDRMGLTGTKITATHFIQTDLDGNGLFSFTLFHDEQGNKSYVINHYDENGKLKERIFFDTWEAMFHYYNWSRIMPEMVPLMRNTAIFAFALKAQNPFRGGGAATSAAIRVGAYPTTRAALARVLARRGFKYSSTSKGGYTTYRHADGRIVTIKPSGEVIPTRPAMSSWGQRYNQRTDFDGIPIQGHGTGHFVEPFGTPK